MKLNVGGADRTGRIVVGVVLVAVAGFAPIGLAGRIVAGVIAAIAFGAAAGRVCPGNAVLGIDTYKGDRAPKE